MCKLIMTTWHHMTQKYLLDIILVGTFTPLGWSKTPPLATTVTGYDPVRSWWLAGERWTPKRCGVEDANVCHKKKRWNSWHRHFSGWWQLKYLFLFTPKIGEDEPIFDSYFSDGLKPPTSILLVRCFFWLILFLDTLWKVWKSWKRK